MPLNATVEYFKAEEKFRNAKTRKEKIAALEEMIREVPKHKGAENLLAQLKTKLSKLKKQKQAKVSRRSFSIPKEGDAQVCIIGLTNSGKSSLLNLLTNAHAKVSDIPYTTIKPVIGTLDYYGVRIQLIEIPSNFKREYMSVVQNSDAVLLLIRNESDKKELEKILKEFRIEKPSCEINEKDAEIIKSKIWKTLGLIKVYTKESGKEAEKKPLVLKKGSTVRNAAKEIHKDFIKNFKFARVWPGKYPGQKVGLNYELKDNDVLEIHA